MCVELKKMFLVVWMIFLLASPQKGLPDQTLDRQGKFLSLFSVVLFSNSPCSSLQRTATGRSRGGTCFRASECASKGGLSSGTCAAGFGVCCIFSTTNGTVDQNCTYIRNEGFPDPFEGENVTPTVTIQKCNSKICSVRLDFESFTLSGPNDAFETDGGNCATESLVITSSTNEPFPTICGQNTGQHVYIDMGNLPDDEVILTFTLTSNSIYEIKTSQIECGTILSQPDTCFQYFTEPTGTISTFNFLDTTTSHLADQRYTICIRPAEGMCCVEYTACADADSQSLSATVTPGINNNAVDMQCGADHVLIPAASTTCSANRIGPVTSLFCGRILNTQVDLNSQFLNIPICDCVAPFELTVVTDGASETNSPTIPNRGFLANKVGVSTRAALRNIANKTYLVGKTTNEKREGLLTNKVGVTTRTALGDIANKTKSFGKTSKGKHEAFKEPLKKGRRKAPTTLENNKAAKRIKQVESEVQKAPKSQNVTLMDVEENQNKIKEISSSSICLADVKNIDAGGEDDPQLVAEYVNEVNFYMRQLEKAQPITENYFAFFKDNVAIKPKMRNLLVDWLVDVHQQFTLLPETLFLAVAILDRYLMRKADKVSTQNLQLVGVTAMLIASKYEEMYPPEMGDFVYVADNAYSRLEIRQTEIEIIYTLDFDFGRPLPLNFLRRNSRAAFADYCTHGMAKYVMELSLVDYRMVHIPPSYLAAAALAFAMKVLDTEGKSLANLWTSTLRYYTSYTLDDLRGTISLVAKVVQTAHCPHGSDATFGRKLKAVTRKYATRKFHQISLLPCLNSDTESLMSLVDF